MNLVLDIFDIIWGLVIVGYAFVAYGARRGKTRHWKRKYNQIALTMWGLGLTTMAISFHAHVHYVGFVGRLLNGIGLLMMIGVPCSADFVNKSKTLMLIRNLIFLIFGSLVLYSLRLF